MQEFIITIAKRDLHTLGSIRCIDGLKAAVDDEQIWIRGLDTISQEQPAIKQLPVKYHFTLQTDGLLFPAGGVTPTGRIKEMEWISIPDFLPVELPSSAGPGLLPGSLTISVIPSKRVHKGMALLTSLSIWKEYGETASAIRLAPLKFAVSEKEEVLIMGEPLPSLPGKEYWINKNMLIPSGYDFEFSITASVLANEICNDGSIVIVDTDGAWFSIDHHFFVPATRSAIRMTQTGKEHE